MGRLIDEWMFSLLIEGYGKKLGPLPRPVKQMTEEWPDNFEKLSSMHVRLIAPLNSEQTRQIKLKLQESANKEIENQVLTAVDQLTALSRLCSHDAQFSADLKGFYCRCRTCETTWSLKTSNDKRVFEMYPKGAMNLSLADDKFNWSGRDWLNFEVSL